MRLFFKNKSWYFIGTRYQGASHNLNALLDAASSAGEMFKLSSTATVFSINNGVHKP